MSWIKDNYHIAALGGGALVLAGLGYLGFSGNKALNNELNANSSPEGDRTSAKGGDLAAAITTSVSEVSLIERRKTAAQDRPVDLFTSVDLFTRGKNSRVLLDLLSMDHALHPPIKNKWWIDHKIDPTFTDSPLQDQDGDGFSNLEEFQFSSDPNDPQSHGDLITKLEVASIESDRWLLLFNSVLGKGYQFNLQYRPFGGRTQINRIPASQAVQKGDTFFSGDPAKDRFLLKEIESREEDGPTGRRLRDWAKVEDQRPNKKGKQYELPFNLPAKDRNDAIQYDHTVVFRLNAIGEAANTFRVEENGVFSLPSGGEDKKYTLVDVKLRKKDRKPIAVVVKTGEDDTKLTEIAVPQPPAQ